MRKIAKVNILTNTFRALADQGPPIRFLKNLISLRLRGVLKRRSHITKDGVPKVAYGSKASAERAVSQMSKKTGRAYSSYKCFHCPGYHIGRNGRNNSLPKVNKQ